ncbi:hypothetical protein GGQ06_003066 [Salinibacter ruber]|nr:hypothetical protein [Salinibacter ruber]
MSMETLSGNAKDQSIFQELIDRTSITFWRPTDSTTW